VTRGGLAALARGLLRLFVIVAVAAVASAIVGVLLGQWRDWSFVRSVVYGFYVGGAVLVAAAFSQTSGGIVSSEHVSGHGPDASPEARRARQASAGLYLAMGVVVLLLGMVLDVVLAAT
jgi:hypothetical protein